MAERTLQKILDEYYSLGISKIIFYQNNINIIKSTLHIQ